MFWVKEFFVSEMLKLFQKLKIFYKPFSIFLANILNHLLPSGNKRSHILKQTYIFYLGSGVPGVLGALEVQGLLGVLGVLGTRTSKFISNYWS